METQIPDWLKTLVRQNKAALRAERGLETDAAIQSQSLHTVCREARCPNRGKCFSEGGATFLILGNVCTRGCRFCAVERGQPQPPDADEPARIAATLRGWKLRYAVITSPTRDDLPDGGAEQFAKTVRAIRDAAPRTLVEPLTPDFAGNRRSLETVLESRPAALAHNMETVPRLYETVRRGADYKRSLDLLAHSKKFAPDIPVKSGIMLGLGETEQEIESVLHDLSGIGCDMLTLGQYLAPSKLHAPVERYPEPAEYDDWKAKALELGFKAVAAGPLVRSSYLAQELYNQLK